jgi:hypothetical protein
MNRLLLIFGIILSFGILHAQTAQWVLNPYPQSNYENDLTRLATDGAGNVYDLVNRSCGSFSCPSMVVFSSSSDGQNTSTTNFPFQVSPQTSYNNPRGIDIVVDSSGNKYITGFCSGDSILINSTWIKSHYFIFKMGTSSWAKPGKGVFTADNQGNCYFSNDTITEKYDAVGNVVWSNPSVGGTGISVDNSGNCFITNLAGTTKLNNSGIVSWSNNIGGTENYLDANKNIYVVNGNQITKRDNVNNPLWVKTFPGSIKRVNKTGNIFTGDGLTLTKYASNGSFSWSYCAVTDSGSIEDIAFDNSGNVFTTGKFYGNQYYTIQHNYGTSITFCPYTLPAEAPNSYLAKISPSLNTSPRLIMQDNLTEFLNYPIENCTAFRIEYATCCDSFGAGNSFTVQLASDTSFANSIVLGAINSVNSGSIMITIPTNVMDSGYIRIISTLPQVASKYRFVKFNKIPFVSTYSSGSTAFCPGKGIVQLQSYGDATFTYQWQKNAIDIPGATTTSYTATTAGNYRVVRTTSTGCSKYSDTTSIYTFPNPASTIQASGPTQFCTGGSLLLTANSGNSFSYQWRKNGAIIGTANAISYSATKTGTYKVQVTNIYGCTKLSSGISVIGPPTATILANGLLSFCAGDSVVLSANAGTGYTYNWKKNGIIINGAMSINYAAKTSGTYKAIITDSYGCSDASNTKTVTVNCRLEEENDLMSSVSIFPNPSGARFHINLSSIEDNILSIRVIDLLGTLQLVFNHINQKDEEFSFGNTLPIGTYIVEIQLKNSSIRKKIVKL